MSELSVYLLSIVGVVLISVIIELILPTGQVTKYIKGIMSLVVIFVISSPLPNLISNGFYLSNITETSTNFDESLLDTIKSQQISLLKSNLEKGLEEKGLGGVNIDIWGDMQNGELKIQTIFVDLKNLVISSDNPHINKYEAVEDFLLKQTGVTSNQVVFYD